MIRVWDAHCHRSLVGDPPRVVGGGVFAIQSAVVNSTQPEDWQPLNPGMLHDAESVRIFNGLHPWFIERCRASRWRGRLEDQLAKGLHGIGEIGLEKSKRRGLADLSEQAEVFGWQLQQAGARNLPVSLHAVGCPAALLEVLAQVRLPERGIHIHDLYASVAIVKQLLRRYDVWFSYGPRRMLHGGEDWLTAIAKVIPDDRLLFETDQPLAHSTHQAASNWPEALLEMAKWRLLPLDALVALVNENAKCYFSA